MTILFLIFVAVLAWVIITYNNLVGLRNIVQNAWKQIDVQLKRRHDLIPNLVNTVKGAMEFERDTLERVMEARNRAVAAQGNVAEASAAENQLTACLRQLFAVVENYPTLKANQNVLQLQEELTTTENQISFARQHYNDNVMRYNTKQQVFPANLVAGQFGFTAAEYFSADEAVRTVPTVDLSLPN